MKKVVKSRSSLPSNAKVSVNNDDKSGKKNNDNEGGKIIANQIKESGNSMVAMMEDLSQQISGIQLTAAQPPTEWEFDFIRDKNQNLKKITAVAKTNIKRLN